MLVGGNVISSVEFHGNMSLVFFMGGCPLRCRYCQNVELLEGGEETSLKEVKNIIDSSADFIDAVVVSGGEPLLQSKDVLDILAYAKSIGLKTKLDTSGISPNRLKLILDENVLDSISLDIKAPFSDYARIVGENVGDKVRQSMDLINEYDVEFEIRTTFVPTLLTYDEVKSIAENIQADIYTLQQFRNRNVLDPALEKVENPNAIELKEFAETLSSCFDGVIKIKTAEFGEQTIEQED